MRVVVTGATGNVGSAVVELLVDDDRVDEIVAIARRRPAEVAPKVTFVDADVGHDDLAPAFAGADAVVHLAWLFQPSHDPVMTWTANAVGSTRVFAAAAEAHVPTVLYASSIGAYSAAPGRMVDESWPTHSLPQAAYGREKAYVERVLDAFEARHENVRVVRLRPAFIFQRPAASEQRRLFVGPFLPATLLRPGRLPIVPVPRDLRFQAVHARDVARAYQAGLFRDVRGPFNIAADPVIDAPALGELMDARIVELPRSMWRTAVAGAWHLHLAPTDPALLELFLCLPLLDTSRARTELGWSPSCSAIEALREALEGMADGAGGPTPPLAADAAARRFEEVATGVGRRDPA